jgi:predicted secreted protein
MNALRLLAYTDVRNALLQRFDIVNIERRRKRMKTLLLRMTTGLFLVLTALSLQAQWAKTYGGDKTEYPRSLHRTSDGGYIVVSMTLSSFSLGDTDIWVMKLNSVGNIQWQKLFGGACGEDVAAVIQTQDGGFAIAGSDNSCYGTDTRALVIKLNAAGDIQWQRAYPGVYMHSWANAIVQTSDSGFIVGATTITPSRGWDFWVMKLSASGDIQWQRAYGGIYHDSLYTLRKAADGGYILLGMSDPLYNWIPKSLWILKLSANGDIQWQKDYGDVRPRDIQPTADGGTIVLACNNDGAGQTDFLVFKLNGNGDIQWQKTYGGASTDQPDCLIQTSDGGYLVSGYTRSFGSGGYDLWIIKLLSNGTIQWQKTYGGSLDDGSAGGLEQLPDGGFIVGGWTDSFGVGGGTDIWILRLFADGEISSACGLTGNSSATVKNTSYTAVSAAATYMTTSIAYQSTSYAPRVPSVSPHLVCAALVPPSNVVQKKEINRALTRQEAFYTITWTANSENSRFSISGYKVYRKESGQSDQQYILAGQVSGNTFKYTDRYLNVSKSYIYAVMTLEEEGLESELSAPARIMRRAVRIR